MKLKRYPAKILALFITVLICPDINHAQEQHPPNVFCSHLPIVIVKPTQAFPTGGTDEELKAKRKATLEIFDANPKDEINGKLNCLNTTPAHVSATMRYRGASSLRFPKHQFSVKLDDAWDLNKNPALHTSHFLGMPFGGKSWVFSAEQPNLDGTYLRNTLSFHLHRQLGEAMPINKAWAPRTRFFELFIQEPNKPLDTQKDYTGLYVLAEHIEFSKSRVYPGLVTSSILYKIDLPKPGDIVVSDNVHTPIVVQDFHKINLENKTKLPPFWHNAFSLWSKSVDPNQHHSNQIHETVKIDGHDETLIINSDEDSFAIAFILNEFIKDPDGYNKNTFMYQTFTKGEFEKTGKNNMITMIAGPSWDKNLAYDLQLPQTKFRNTGGFLGYGTPYAGTTGWTFGIKHKFWKDMLQHQSVQDKICHYWFKAKRDNTLTYPSISGFLDKKISWIHGNKEHNSVKRDCDRYFPHSQCSEEFDAKVTLLKNYIQGRLEWMDSQLGTDENDCKTKIKPIITKETGH